ncbi:MAG TPA: hypothetical protein VE093_03525 [Polyangiaceae bacterium]|jgi:hypothetical protein|nr:hypothetical protein [Polyangiaceae bacterium]
MSSEQRLDPAVQWLAERHAVPALEDRSLHGRRAFVEAHGDVLWAFWSEALSIAFASGSLDPRAALGEGWSGSEKEAGEEAAERLLTALTARPVLEAAPAWTNVERWYAWLVSGQALRARREPEPPRARLNEKEAPEVADELSEVVDFQRLLSRWCEVLRSLVERTGILRIEFDWLWATRVARRPLAALPSLAGAYGPLADTDLERCIQASSVAGEDRSARIKRTRAGACAAFRFNLEELASRAVAPTARGTLAVAREVFVGPAQKDPPYRPKLPVDAPAFEGFREALRRGAETAQRAGKGDRVERLWAAVLGCGLQKEASRLLPRPMENQLRAEWGALVGAPAQDAGEGEER